MKETVEKLSKEVNRLSTEFIAHLITSTPITEIDENEINLTVNMFKSINTFVEYLNKLESKMDSIENELKKLNEKK